MNIDYMKYLNTLIEIDKNKQLIIFILFWIAIFIIAIIVEIINKFNKTRQKKHKNQP